jgi:hypothetical protein
MRQKGGIIEKRRMRQKGGIREKRRIIQMGDMRQERDGWEKTLEETENERDREESQKNERRTRI